MISNKLARMFLRNTAYILFLMLGAKQEQGVTYQTELAKELRQPLTSINYWITKFKGEGLIDPRLKLTEKGVKVFKFLWKNEKKKVLRAHNLQVIFPLMRCPSNFPGCFSKEVYQFITNKRYKGIKAELKGTTVMFYSPHKIVCVLRDIYGDNDEDISATIQVCLHDLIKVLEEEFSGIVLGEPCVARIQTMHIAILNSIIAKSESIKGFTRENSDFAIDSSHGIPEVELTNPSTALRDIMELVDYERGLREARDKENKSVDIN